MKNIFSFSILTLSCFVFILSCNTDLESLDRIPADELLLVNFTKNSSPIKTKVRVFARIPKTSGLQDVSFVTTGGLFEESGKTEANQLTDSVSGNYRYAPLWLSSVKVPDTVYVTAELKGLRKRAAIIFFK